LLGEPDHGRTGVNTQVATTRLRDVVGHHTLSATDVDDQLTLRDGCQAHHRRYSRLAVMGTAPHAHRAVVPGGNGVPARAGTTAAALGGTFRKRALSEPPRLGPRCLVLLHAHTDARFTRAIVRRTCAVA